MMNNIEKENTENPEFKKNALEILKENTHLIVFTRFLSNKDHFYLKNEKEFDEFLSSRISSECLTLFKNPFNIIHHGIVNKQFIKEVKEKIAQEESIEWVAMGKDEDHSHWSAWVSDEQEFEEVIEDELGKEVMIIEDQDWFNEDITIHAYVPDKDGIVRLSAY